MNKRMCYNNENFSSVILSIYLLILIIIWLYFKTIMTNDEALAIFLVAALFFLIPIVIELHKYYIQKKYEKIMKNGRRVSGIIADYKSYRGRKLFSKHKTTYWHLTISYIDPYTRQEQIYETPDINFNPITELGDKGCAVYLYDKEIYVTDFVKRKKNQPYIWESAQSYVLSERISNIIAFVLVGTIILSMLLMILSLPN